MDKKTFDAQMYKVLQKYETERPGFSLNAFKNWYEPPKKAVWQGRLKRAYPQRNDVKPVSEKAPEVSAPPVPPAA